MATQARGKRTGFQEALLVQTRVVGALILREMRVRYGSSQIGYVWALAEPVAYIAAMVAMFSYIDRPPPFGTSMALFFALGIIPFRMFANVSNQLTAAMQANEALLTYPIVRQFDTVLARFILEAMTSIAIFVICLGGLSLIDDHIRWPSHPLRLAEGLALILLLDQVPRNVFRDSAHAFATDPLALAYARRAIDAGFDTRVDPALRIFFYMPFEHSEAMADQDRTIALVEAMGAEYCAHHIFMKRAEVDKQAGKDDEAQRDFYVWYV